MDILLEIKKQRDVQLERERALLQRPSFKEALSKKGISIIGEIKRASPSKGPIANEQFDLIPQAQSYQQKGVAAFSILTEEAYFKGDNLFIPSVKEAIPTIPILRKDFIYTPFQVAHSKFLGVSAILLIVRMLNDTQLLSLHHLARDLDLDVLVEVHDAHELERALAIPELAILGINNRNLNTFEVSLATTEQLLQQLPKERREKLIVVSESGFHSAEDIAYAEQLGVDALLIGEALMKGEI